MSLKKKPGTRKEQIEVSRFYERLPKPGAIAMQELGDDDLFWRESKTED